MYLRPQNNYKFGCSQAQTPKAAKTKRNKPSGAKGRYWKSLYVTSTMGPSVEVDFSALQDIEQGS